LESTEAAEDTDAGDELEVDLICGKVRNMTRGKEYTAKPYPHFMSELINVGGLVAYTKRRLAQSGPNP